MKRTLLAAAAAALAVLPVAAGAAQTWDSPYGGPPGPHAFGPDSTSTGVFTGQGTTTPGLNCTDSSTTQVRTCTGFLASSVDQTLLDVTVEVPLATPGPHPLITLVHGWGGSKTDSSGWDPIFLNDGFTLLRYSCRGFGKSWGQTNLADLNVELADLRSLVGQVVDDPRFEADGGHLAVIGASYGGGHSYGALLHPSWTSPHGHPLNLRTVVPIVPWTDLEYSLVPNGRPDSSLSVAGSAKLSYVEALYAGGMRHDSSRPYPSYPAFLTAWNADGANEPNLNDPVFRQMSDGLAGYRSISWQQAFWQQAKTSPIPVFEIQGWTDDLFPAPEALRMYYALRAVNPGYPIALYFGDIGHPRAATKAAEVDYVLNQLVKPWFDYYLKGSGTAPALDVKAAITRPGPGFSASDVIEVPTYDALAGSWNSHHFGGTQTLTFNPASTGGFQWDPVVITGSESLSPNPPAPPPDEVPGDVASYRLALSQPALMAGEPQVTVNLSTLAYREQLNFRIFDVAPDGTKQLVTRGTYTLDTGNPALILGDKRVTITGYGNLWQFPAGHTLLLELTNVDSPYINPSKVPSVTQLSGVDLLLPMR
ncbi:MAG TPA: CocE/NonD family hydrolase [Candidatus Dormibacteraeota bacterium]